jgi:hypothetical protein
VAIERYGSVTLRKLAQASREAQDVFRVTCHPGAFLLGVYLFVSIRAFGRHGNEAFSSLRIADYKHWLRLRIDAAGVLTIFAVAIDRVPRRWRAATRNGEKTQEASDAHASEPRLIDKVEVRP